MNQPKETIAARPGAAVEMNKETIQQQTVLLPYSHRPHDLHQECLQDMASNDIPFSGPLELDGQIKRFSIDAKKNQPDEWYTGRYWEYQGRCYLMCHYGSWSTGSNHVYKSWEAASDLTSETVAQLEQCLIEIKKIAQAEEEERHNKAEIEASVIWNSASPAPLNEKQSAYLGIKKIQGYGIRFGKNPSGYDCLIIPLRKNDGMIRSLQFISVDESGKVYKSFLTGGQKRGFYFVLGDQLGDEFYVAEGYATAASIHEATGKPVVVAFDCGNLDPVLAAVREKYAKQKIIIAADDDVEVGSSKSLPNGNPGRTKSMEAAKKYSCEAKFPKFDPDFKLPNGKLPTDWNDLHFHFGIQAVREQLQSDQKKKPSSITFDLKELIHKPIPQRELVLRPWLPQAGISMVFAPPGVGKTNLCLSVSITIASGGVLFGWVASKPRKVFYLDAEMHESDLQNRVKKFLGAQSIPNGYLRYWNGGWQSDLNLPDLSTTEGQQLVEETIDYYNMEVLFLDNISTLCRTGKENESESWRRMQSWLLKLRWKGITTVLIHHAGKTKDASGNPVQRGTSMREVVLESSLVLSHPKNYTPEQGCVFEVKFAKARGFYGTDCEPFEAKLIEKEGVYVWESRSLVKKNYDLVMDFLNEDITNPKEIAMELGISRQAVEKHIKRAKKCGDIL